MHIANRYQTHVDQDRLNMQANIARLNNLFAIFDQKVRPVTKRSRQMLIAKKLQLKPEPTPQQIDREMDELKHRIFPMLNQQLEGKRYFCGDVPTGYDL